MLLISSICHTPIVIWATLLLHAPFQQVDHEKTKKSSCWHDQLLISEQILAWWQCPVAFSEALDLLCWAMCAVLYWHIAMAIKMSGKVGAVVFPVALAAAEAIWSELLPGVWCKRGWAKTWKTNILLLSQSCNWKPILYKVILNVYQSIKKFKCYINPPPQQSILSNYLSASHSFDMSHPYC